MRIKCLLAFVAAIVSVAASGQVAGFRYQRQVEGVEAGWHRLVLPDELFGKVRPDLADIRVIGVSAGGDTIEAPYLLDLPAGRLPVAGFALPILNRSKYGGRHYFTLEMPAGKTLNRLQLDFSIRNFDLRIKLEGSQDQQQWFAILEDYRILSLHNDLTDYSFTTLVFPDVNYRFLRLSVPGPPDPGLLAARYRREVAEADNYRQYASRLRQTSVDTRLKQTTLDVALPMPLPVSRVRIGISDSFDYYRPIEIRAPADSSGSPENRRLNYKTLGRGTISSLEPAVFNFPGMITPALQIVIRNHDNEPLLVDTVIVEGNPPELLVRFSRPADYRLVYGNPRASPPNYDLEVFRDQIPAGLSALKLGPEETRLPPDNAVKPLFQNKAVLWAVMTAVILLLGWFTVRMIRRD